MYIHHSSGNHRCYYRFVYLQVAKAMVGAMIILIIAIHVITYSLIKLVKNDGRADGEAEKD